MVGEAVAVRVRLGKGSRLWDGDDEVVGERLDVMISVVDGETDCDGRL